jgi:hypothetical protein
MKTIYIHFCLIALFFSCSPKDNPEKDKQTKQTANEEKIASENAAFKKKRFDEYLPDFQQLVLNYDGVVRGVDIGNTVDELKGIEKASLASSSPDKIVYKTDLSSDESAEITYFLENGKVNGIEFLIGQSSTDEVSAFILEFTDFFTNKYGPVDPNDNGSEVWKTPSGHEVTIMDLSKGDAYQIMIVVRK